MDFLQTLQTTLKTDTRFISREGILLKPKIVDAATSLDPKLIRLLLNEPTLKSYFFTEIDGIFVFDKEKFQWIINSKEFLPDSYTKYRNKIGLSSNDHDLIYASSEVTLVWPYKDCVLEGGQNKEDEKRDEIFYNETLAPDEIGRLLAPKAFKNAVRYTAEGKQQIDTFSEDDNLIIKGNNLLALTSLLERYEGKVKCIYIDPPYNTGNDDFKYNDKFNHSTWLTFMRNRLTLASKLLTNDGLLFVQCDDNEQAYLKVLMDEIFGRNNFVNVISVKTKVGGVSGSSEGKSLKDETEFINLYFKDKNAANSSLNPSFIETELGSYIRSYKSSGKSWKYTTVLTQLGGKVLLNDNQEFGERLYGYRDVKTMSVTAFAREQGLTEDEVYQRYAEKIIRTTNAQSSIRKRVVELSKELPYEIIGFEYSPIKGKNRGQTVEVLYKGTSRSMVMQLSDVVTQKNGDFIYRERVGTLWSDVQYNNLTREGAISFPNGKKPEFLIQRVLDIGSKEGDLVLDFHLGSGTTAAVAHKMGRRYIGVEQIDYVETVTVPRMQKVIEGEQSGISKTQGWHGGGSFVYVELAERGEQLMEQLETANDVTGVHQVLDEATKRGLLRPSVLPRELRQTAADFDALSLDEQKQVVAELIDKNRLYVNAADMDDVDTGLSEADKSFTQSFYNQEAKS